ncbi:U4/U6.U5 small nuclear ribonucleoprotein 27 kDa protein-like protein [Leptotrombidium deliense]|uniref:U4/U6.U5 small nuclear ribonucleoprotein 27 kDa protein-like protein n=1 Tax=Leptotrombidium deliense TaxID=299467 RepID=A0A443SHU1_9ACAR|nr:U4/U6.U5 small nuclear ribonucleoprotein 27 kDa protein-like protein [Leptotrombidium deliense]
MNDLFRLGEDEEAVQIHEKSLKGGAVPTFLLQRPEITDKDLEGKTEEEQEMLKLMGFGGFDSTKVTE